MRSIVERNDHAELAAGVTGAVREEAIVVASRATGGRDDVLDAELAKLGSKQRAQVDVRRPIGRATGQLPIDIRADLVALAADPRSEMRAELARREAPMRELSHPSLGDATRRSPPPRMQERDRA